jgi:hypothetical protein
MPFIASAVPSTAGMPSSRATMAAWEVRPPRSVTMPAAIFMIGSQSGSVLSVTRISPFSNRAKSLGLAITRARPTAIPSPTARPWASVSPRPVSR